MADRLYTARDVAEMLGVSVRRVYQLAKSRRLGRQLRSHALLFTEADLANMRVRKTGRPPKDTRPRGR
jgi:hypothetical protein